MSLSIFVNPPLCCFSPFHLVWCCCRLSKSFLLFFSGWLCHFNGLFNSPVQNSMGGISWQLTNRTVSDISHHSWHSICQSFFSHIKFVIWFKSIQLKQVDLETLTLAWSLQDLMHWNSFRSLLRNQERSTCNKSDVTLSRPCCLSEFYANRLEPH